MGTLLSLTELALGGLAAAALATAPAALRALKRSDPLLSRRALGGALVFVATFYAAASTQMLLLRTLVPAAAAIWAAWTWMVSAPAADDDGRSGVAPRVRDWPVAALKAFALACPALAVLGGEQHPHVATTDFVAAALFAGGLALGLTTTRAVWAHMAMATAFWVLAWREPSGFLTVFAPMLAGGEAVAIMSHRSQVFTAPRMARREKSSDVGV